MAVRFLNQRPPTIINKDRNEDLSSDRGLQRTCDVLDGTRMGRIGEWHGGDFLFSGMKVEEGPGPGAVCSTTVTMSASKPNRRRTRPLIHMRREKKTDREQGKIRKRIFKRGRKVTVTHFLNSRSVKNVRAPRRVKEERRRSKRFQNPPFRFQSRSYPPTAHIQSHSLSHTHNPPPCPF